MDLNKPPNLTCYLAPSLDCLNYEGMSFWVSIISLVVRDICELIALTVVVCLKVIALTLNILYFCLYALIYMFVFVKINLLSGDLYFRNFAIYFNARANLFTLKFER